MRKDSKESKIKEKSNESGDFVRVDKDVFKCKRCQAIIKKQSNVLQHLAVHKNEDKDAFDFNKVQNGYECKKCHSIITNRRNLNQHRRIHVGGKKIECSECSKEYTKQSDLNRHVRKAHKKE